MHRQNFMDRNIQPTTDRTNETPTKSGEMARKERREPEWILGKVVGNWIRTRISILLVFCNKQRGISEGKPGMEIISSCSEFQYSIPFSILFTYFPTAGGVCLVRQGSFLAPAVIVPVSVYWLSALFDWAQIQQQTKKVLRCVVVSCCWNNKGGRHFHCASQSGWCWWWGWFLCKYLDNNRISNISYFLAPRYLYWIFTRFIAVGCRWNCRDEEKCKRKINCFICGYHGCWMKYSQ